MSVLYYKKGLVQWNIVLPEWTLKTESLLANLM